MSQNKIIAETDSQDSSLSTLSIGQPWWELISNMDPKNRRFITSSDILGKGKGYVKNLALKAQKQIKKPKGSKNALKKKRQVMSKI